jgi:hypothetical protein
MSTVQEPAVAVEAGSPDVDAPRVPLSHLTGAAADEAREIGRRRLAEFDRRPDPSGLFGSSGGPDRVTREEVRPRTIAFYVYDDQAVASGAAWHRYWRSVSDPRRGYPTTDPKKAAAAPPSPSRGIRCVATATWAQLRDWLDGPEQTSLFDMLGGGA